MPIIAAIVEGDGDVEAAPLLVRRILQERLSRHDIAVAKPLNAHGLGNLRKEDGLERFLGYARQNQDWRAVLVLRDTDGDCPVDLAKGFARRARQVHLRRPVAVACAHLEYESWFLASIETLRGVQGIVSNAPVENSPEEVRDPKRWLTRQMPPGRVYKETLDQTPLTAHMDFDLAYRRSRSFRRFCHAVEQLVQGMDTGRAIVTP